jgi:2-C-methyl-D-erythritol 4-phosphate cytidylyltransferase / 2-C-methyl-D-erythritol 2,4-cyclodiphosphate synthase
MKTAKTTARVCALIPAAGRGARFGAAENKVFAPLLGRPLLGWTLEAFAHCAVIDAIILVGAEAELPRLQALGEQFGGGKLLVVVPGGDSRQASVRLGLDALPETCELVAIHDAARCCITPDLIESVIESARFWGAATASQPVRDTLTYEEPEGVTGYPTVGPPANRDELRAVQTPQVFPFEKICAAHAKARSVGAPATDDATLYAQYLGRVALASGALENLKVTTPEDLTLAEAILRNRTSPPVPLPCRREGGGEERAGGLGALRVGHGYDVHRFASGREMWLGGVHFPESALGLDGHSDADVVLHALCDALLGAAGLPDIGQLFPPSDMAHKNRASIEFLNEVKTRLDAGSWGVGNVDLTVIAETPKIGPRAAEIKNVIAEALEITSEQVSVKATTNETMGFVGRREGIAAHATVLLSKRS